MDLRSVTVFLVIFFHASLIHGSPCKDDKDHPKAKIKGKCDASNYLKRYGYTLETVAGLNEESQRGQGKTKKALKAFQKVNKLPITGELDSLTERKMNQPRCGKSDQDLVMEIEPAALQRVKRYVKSGRKWDVPIITYKITSYTNDLTQAQQDDIFAKAFNAWAVAGNVKFSQLTSGDAHIVIYFGTGTHGEVNSFDGPGGMLAHAYYPSSTGTGYSLFGDAHFDDDEDFTDQTVIGTNLYYVVVHEIGHSLGLAHSYNQDAIMAPYYRAWDPSVPYLALHQDDINGIVAIYGPSTVVTSPPTTTPTPAPTRPPATISCSTMIDAMAAEATGLIFVFQGTTVVETKMTSSKRTTKISTNHIDAIFPNAPSNLDAAFTAGGAKAGTYLCKGNECWRYQSSNGNYQLMSGYPKTLQDDFGVNIGGATLKTVYVKSTIDFVAGTQYWSYGNSGLKLGYPKALTRHAIFRIFTGGIDASVAVPGYIGLVATGNTVYTWSQSRRGVRVKTVGTVSSFLMKC